MHTRSLALVALLLTACGSATSPDAPAVDAPAPPAVPKPTADAPAADAPAADAPAATAPSAVPEPAVETPLPASAATPAVDAPFDAAAIRAATAPGRTYLHRSSQPGSPPVILRTRFIAADDTGATIEVTPITENARPAGPSRKATMTWADFASHGKPKPGTMRSEGPCEVPAGRFDCIFFEVDTPDGRRRDAFARSLPGMPVQSAVMKEGDWVPVMVLLDHRPGGASPDAAPTTP